MFSLLLALGSLAGLGACKAKNSMDEASRRMADKYYREVFERKEAERRRFSDKYRASQQLIAEAGHKASTLEINGDQIRIRKLIQQEVGIDPNTGMVYHTLIGEHGKIHPSAVINGYRTVAPKDVSYCTNFNFYASHVKFMEWYGSWLQEHGVEYEMIRFSRGWGWEPIRDLLQYAKEDVGCGRPLDKNVSTPMNGDTFYNWGEGDIVKRLKLDGSNIPLYPIYPFDKKGLEEIKKYLNLNSYEDVEEYLRCGDFEAIKIINPKELPYQSY